MSSGGSASATASTSTSTSTATSVLHPEAGQQQHVIEMAPLTDAPSQPRQGLGEIPRVRALLHRAAGDLFTPQTVLIGPYHQEVGSYSFPSTRLKNKAVQDIVVKHKVNLAALELHLYDLVDHVRACYTYLPQNTLDKKAFNTMLLYDGCYLLSFFRDFYRSTETSAGGAGSSSGVGGGRAANPMILDNDNTIVRDILYLLENQIPLCVLEKIMNYLAATTDVAYTPEVISPEVRNRLHKQHYISKEKQPATSTASDLLHLVYSYFRGRPPVAAMAQEECCPTGRWRRATDYRKYAVQFRRRKFKDDEKWSILDLDLQGGTLHIPFLRVGADTWTMLRNLMALEEQEQERPVTAYCVFLSQVACTAEDVQLLQRAKILEHFMPSDEEAAKAFAYLCNGVALDIDKLERNYLRHVWHHLHKRCSSRMYNFKGLFCEKHCSNVFYFLVFIIGLLLFVSEMAQGFYAAFGYHDPHATS